MRSLVLVALAACSSPAQPKHNAFPDFPVEPPPPSDAGSTEQPPFQPIGEGTPPTVMPKVGDRMPASGSTSIASTGCIPAGTYAVSVDLSAAQLSQTNTGQSDLTWCKSMLEGIPRAAMATMRIVVSGGQLSIEWPPGQPARLSPGGDCSFVITSPPMVSSISFANGRGSGTASYSVGTQNHPDERCSATGAVLTIVPSK
jgi:hypothetical protein